MQIECIGGRRPGGMAGRRRGGRTIAIQPVRDLWVGVNYLLLTIDCDLCGIKYGLFLPHDNIH